MNFTVSVQADASASLALVSFTFCWSFSGVTIFVSDVPAVVSKAVAILLVYVASRSAMYLSGDMTNGAHVEPVAVPADTSALVAISTFPETVSEAFGIAPSATATQAPPLYI